MAPVKNMDNNPKKSFKDAVIKFSNIKKMSFLEKILSIFGVSYSEEVMVSVVKKVNACSENEINMLNKIANLEELLNKEEEKLNKSIELNDAISKQRDTYKDDISVANEKNRKLTGELEKLKDTVAKRNEENKSLEESLNDIRVELNKANDNKTYLRNEITILRADNDELRNMLNHGYEPDTFDNLRADNDKSRDEVTPNKDEQTTTIKDNVEDAVESQQEQDKELDTSDKVNGGDNPDTSDHPDMILVDKPDENGNYEVVENNSQPNISTETTSVIRLNCDLIKEARFNIEQGSTIGDEANRLGVTVDRLTKALNCETFKHCCEDSGAEPVGDEELPDINTILDATFVEKPVKVEEPGADIHTTLYK